MELEALFSLVALVGAAARIFWKGDKKLTKAQIVVNIIVGALFGYVSFLQLKVLSADNILLTFIIGLGSSDIIEHLIALVPVYVKNIMDYIRSKK